MEVGYDVLGFLAGWMVVKVAMHGQQRNGGGGCETMSDRWEECRALVHM